MARPAHTKPSENCSLDLARREFLPGDQSVTKNNTMNRLRSQEVFLYRARSEKTSSLRVV
jgi:hypothetical protein